MRAATAAEVARRVDGTGRSASRETADKACTPVEGSQALRGTSAPQPAMLAAAALHHDPALVTRNTRDFEGLSVRLVNPWEG